MTTSARPRPEARPLPLCNLPAIAGWTVYDYATGKPSWVEVFPYCRFHEQTEHAAARRAAEKVGAKASVYPVDYTSGQSRLACAGERNPRQLGAVLDAERIAGKVQAIQAALRELTSLTTVAYDDSYEVGNEGAVLVQLLELVDDVESEAGVVARRLAMRSPAGWFAVAEHAGGIRPTDSPAARLSVATARWERWGGGPGDEVAPTLESSAGTT